MGNQCPKLGHSLPIVWALIALRSGTRVNSPMSTITLGENILKLRVVSATFEVRRKLYENANPIAKKWVENLPHMPKWWYFSPKSWYIDDTFWEVYGKYHYDKLSVYQSVAKEVKRNDDTMILFSKKKLFVRKSRRLFAEPSRIKPCYFKWRCDLQGVSRERWFLHRNSWCASWKWFC